MHRDYTPPQPRICDHCGQEFLARVNWLRFFRSRTGRYCSPECRAAALRARAVAGNDARFWAKVEITDTCWRWKQPPQTAGGYGRFWVDGRSVAAHRYAYELTYGPIPKGLFVCHSCDNHMCVRPDHLFLGTTEDNMADMVRKGRAASGARHGRYTKPERTARGDKVTARRNPESLPHGDQHWTRTNPEKIHRGEQQHSAKLTEASVRAIRRRYAAGGVSYQQLATEYSVTKRAIISAVLRVTWRHVD